MKIVVAARNEEHARIASVRFEGHSTFTPLQTALRVAECKGIMRTTSYSVRMPALA